MTVNPINDAPVGAPTANLVAGSEDVAYTVNAVTLLQGFSDIDGDTLRVANLTASSGVVVDNGNGTFTITQAPDINGTITLTYDVIDGNGGSLTGETRSYVLAAINDAPRVGAPPSSSVLEDSGLTILNLLAGASDVDLDTLNVANLTGLATGLTQVGNTLRIDANNTAFQSLSAGTPRNLSIAYNVVDGNGGIAPQTATVTVTGVNDAPTVANAIADRSATTGVAFALTVSANTFADVDTGDVRTLSVSSLPTWLIFNATTGQFTGTPRGADIGTFNITVTATDSGNLTASDAFQITVADATAMITNGNAGGLLAGTAGPDVFNPLGGNDTVNAGAGDDTVLASINDGNDVYNGGAGNDKVDYSGTTANLIIDLDEGFARGAQTGFDQLRLIENVTSGSGNDTIVGNGARNVLDGGAGNDRIRGGGAADVIIGGDGNDTMTGGGGPDAFAFKPNFGKDVITDFNVADTRGSLHDIIELDRAIFSQFATVQELLASSAVAQVGTSVVITADFNDSITLQNVSLVTLRAHADDFRLA